MLIKIDSAIILDTFSILRNLTASIIFIFLKFNIYKDNDGINVVKINTKEISNKIKMDEFTLKKGLNALIKHKFISNKLNDVYYIFDEHEYFNDLRRIRREKFYTRGVVFKIKKRFFNKFLRKIKNDYLAFRIYYFLLIITQHDLWPNAVQVRSKTPMTQTTKLARVWCMDDIFFKSIKTLIDIGIIIIDHKHKVHTFTKFMV